MDENAGNEVSADSGSVGTTPTSVAPDTVVARLVIEMRADSSIRVEGCVADKVLAYGLLQAAKDAIFEKHFEKKLTPINTNGKMLNFLRGKR